MVQEQIIIQRQILEIEQRTTINLGQFFSDWMLIFREQIQPVLQQVLSKYLRHDELLILERVEIEVPFRNLKDLAAGIAIQLSKQVESLLNDKKEQAAGILRRTAVEQKLDMLRRYLTSGTLPSWYVTSDPNPLPSIVRQLEKDKPAQLRQLFQELAHLPGVLIRIKKLGSRIDTPGFRSSLPLTEQNLIKDLRQDQLPISIKQKLWQQYLQSLSGPAGIGRLRQFFRVDIDRRVFSATTLRQLWNTYLGAEKQVLEAYLEDGKKLLSYRNFLSPVQTELSVRMAAIRYKLDRGDKPFQPAYFLDEWIEELALRKQTTTSKIWEQIGRLIADSSLRATFQGPLPDLLLQYRPPVEGQQRQTRPGPEQDLPLVTAVTYPPVIAFLLHDRKLTGSRSEQALYLEDVFWKMLRENDTSLQKHLLEIFRQPAAVDRLLTWGSTDLFEGLLAACFPAYRKALLRLLIDLEKVFSTKAFPNTTLDDYRKALRRQLPLISPRFSDPYPLLFKQLWIKIVSYFNQDIRKTTAAITMASPSKRLGKLLLLLASHRSTTEIAAFLEALDRLPMSRTTDHTEIELQLTLAQSRLAYQLQYGRSAWWQAGLPILSSQQLVELFAQRQDATLRWIAAINIEALLSMRQRQDLQTLLEQRLAELDLSPDTSSPDQQEMPAATAFFDPTNEATPHLDVNNEPLVRQFLEKALAIVRLPAGPSAATGQLPPERIMQEAQYPLRLLLKLGVPTQMIEQALDLIDPQQIAQSELPVPITKKEMGKPLSAVSALGSPVPISLSENVGLQQSFRDLEFFLQTGFPVPSGATLPKWQFEKNIIQLLRKEPDLFRVFLQRGFVQKKWKLEALEKLSSKTLITLAALLFNLPRKTLDHYWHDLRHLIQYLTPATSRKRIQVTFQQTLIRLLRDHRESRVNASAFLLAVVEALSTSLAIKREDWMNLLFSQTPYSGHNLRSDLKIQLYRTFGSPNFVPKDQELLEIERLLPGIESKRESYYIDNAGLILLGPWLPQYFKRLELLGDQGFKDRAAQERAVHCLQYLVTKQTETPEYQLVFNKILCGLPVADPIIESFVPEQWETDIADQLLQVIIQNWPQLGNTSAEGLRGGFLAREGKLQEVDDHWQLKVEAKAFDVLLEYLPWGISMVMLPWMEKRIQCDWK